MISITTTKLYTISLVPINMYHIKFDYTELPIVLYKMLQYSHTVIEYSIIKFNIKIKNVERLFDNL